MSEQETEVAAKARRRKFSMDYKLKLLDEADKCTKPGELGALLRREGLYSSHLSDWRKQRDLGELEPKKRGPKARPTDERDRQIAKLQQALAQQTRRAERAELLVGIQKKLSQLLGIELPTPPSDEEA